MDSLQALPTYLRNDMVESLFFPSKLFYYMSIFSLSKEKSFLHHFPTQIYTFASHSDSMSFSKVISVRVYLHRLVFNTLSVQMYIQFPFFLSHLPFPLPHFFFSHKWYYILVLFYNTTVLEFCNLMDLSISDYINLPNLQNYQIDEDSKTYSIFNYFPTDGCLSSF